MTIPHSKILSPSIMSHKVKADTKTQVNTAVNINLQGKSDKTNEEVTPVIYPPPSEFPEVEVIERDIPVIEPDDSAGVSDLEDSVEFLKLVIDAYKNNAIYYNKYVVLTDTDLCNLLQTILHADEISITYDEDFDAYCCCLSSTFSKIDGIYVVKDDVRYNLKYNYNDVYNMIDSYSISLSYVKKA